MNIDPYFLDQNQPWPVDTVSSDWNVPMSCVILEKRVFAPCFLLFTVELLRIIYIIVYRYIQYLLNSERLKFINFFTSKRLNLNIGTMDVFILLQRILKQ